ncbi:MAG: transglutaminase-like domain-containing protein [Lachnospiraceae bacterium]|nr:transglutaminase-like domain-containing protein [Lachnospiraceae bacterium]
MSKNKSGATLSTNGIAVKSDISMSLKKNGTSVSFEAIRYFIAVLSSLAVIFMLEGFLQSDDTSLYITNPANVLAVVFLIPLAAACTKRESLLVKLIGFSYLILNTIYVLLNMGSTVNGVLYVVNCYAQKSDVNASGIFNIDIYPSELEMFFLSLSLVISLFISIACIYRINFPLFFIATFPIFELGTFWGWETYTWTVVVIIITWIIVLSLNLINHVSKKRNGSTFAIHLRKNAFYFTSESLKKSFFGIAAVYIIIVSALAMSVTGLFALRTDNYRSEELLELRKSISSGFSQFISDLSSGNLFKGAGVKSKADSGGINNGRLGLYDSISFSGETALEVEMESYDCTVYLRGYVGESYSSNRWTPIEVQESDADEFEDDGGIVLDYSYFRSLSETSHTMTITPVNADKDIIFAPYMTFYSYCDNVDEQEYDGMIYAKKSGKEYTVETALPTDISCQSMIIQAQDALNNSFITTYEDGSESYDPDPFTFYVNSVQSRSEFSYVPDNLTEILDQIILDAQISDDDLINTTVAKIANYFYDEGFYYTKVPGATPSGEDFIEYFLTQQQKGYCTHFASAGVMLMRRLGYQARYVEGYIITPEQSAEGGTITVTDRSAHAWCEVFIEGVGWFPLEFTLGYTSDSSNLLASSNDSKASSSSKTDAFSQDDSSDSESSSSSSADSQNSSSQNELSSLSSSDSYNESDDTQTDSSIIESSLSDDSSTDASNVGAVTTASDGSQSECFILSAQAVYTIIIICFALLILIIIVVRRKAVLEIHQRKIGGEDLTKNVIYCYTSVLKYLSLIDITANGNLTDSQLADKVLDLLKESFPELCEDFSQLAECAEKAYLSNIGSDEDEAELARKALEKTSKAVWEKLGVLKRFAAKWFRAMY